jgi:hypothetical protein
MNNPFGLSGSTSAPALNHINNPFDSDPNSARNRFPELPASSGSAFQSPLPSQSPTSWQHQQQNLWNVSPSPYSFQHQQPSSFQSTATQPQHPQHHATSSYGALPSPTSNFFAPFPNGSELGSIHGLGGGVGPGGSKFTGMGVASGGPYTAVAPMLETSASYNGIAGDLSGYNSPNTNSGIGGGLPRTSGSATSPHPLLAQFDPLSTAASNTPSTSFSSNGSTTGAYPPNQGYHGQGQQNPVRQSQMIGYEPSTPRSSDLAAGMDSGQLYRAPGPQPGTMSVTGFGGTFSVVVRVRPHGYGTADHPRQIVQMHRAELEQWDAYGWRQTLNSLESLRFTWENWRDDLGRGTSDVRAGSKEEAVMKAVSLNALQQNFWAGADNMIILGAQGCLRKTRCGPYIRSLVPGADRTFGSLDIITAAYLQMQEVYVSYRQSSDPTSKKRVRECLNAGLRNLPDWP